MNCSRRDEVDIDSLGGNGLMTTGTGLRTAETVRLRDGRRLGFAEVGDLAGKPILFFHGGGDSRLTRHPDDAYTASLGIRLITVDRPGVGLSDFQPRRRLLDWPDDVVQLAGSLSIERFAVLGWSMGGPHALVCASAIPDRLLWAGVVSGLAPLAEPGMLAGMTPFYRRLFGMARRSHRVVQVPLALKNRYARRNPAAYMDGMFVGAPENDRAIYALPGVRDNKSAGFAEVVRAGSRGLSLEMTMVARPWGFRLEDIAIPVRLWYGSQDLTTPLFMARFFEEHIPQTILTVFEGDGHQMIYKRWREILTS